ncbi:hypothetical protein D9M70_442320 [compost metagenome]
MPVIGNRLFERRGVCLENGTIGLCHGASHSGGRLHLQVDSLAGFQTLVVGIRPYHRSIGPLDESRHEPQSFAVEPDPTLQGKDRTTLRRGIGPFTGGDGDLLELGDVADDLVSEPAGHHRRLGGS